VDVLRALRLGAYGLLIDGPVGSLWYDALERWVWPSDPSSTKAVLAKTALDQVVYATIMTGARACVCWQCVVCSGRVCGRCLVLGGAWSVAACVLQLRTRVG
jgi:hypothetical protein